MAGEPLETHHHETMTLSAWFAQNVQGWTPEQRHPVAVASFALVQNMERYRQERSRRIRR